MSAKQLRGIRDMLLGTVSCVEAEVKQRALTDSEFRVWLTRCLEQTLALMDEEVLE